MQSLFRDIYMQFDKFFWLASIKYPTRALCFICQNCPWSEVLTNFKYRKFVLQHWKRKRWNWKMTTIKLHIHNMAIYEQICTKYVGSAPQVAANKNDFLMSKILTSRYKNKRLQVMFQNLKITLWYLEICQAPEYPCSVAAAS